LHWIGVAVPIGRLTIAQMRGLAEISRDMGDGDIRLTVWQNLLISGVPSKKLRSAQAKIEALGLGIEANAMRNGLVACTGNTGCKFAASDTKRHAEEIARWCETRVVLDTPVNIHLTGCHHSCAQHFISEIGMLACKVQETEDGDAVEGYHVLIGGGFGPQAALVRELYRDVKADDAPKTIERILKTYLAHRASHAESFIAFPAARRSTRSRPCSTRRRSVTQNVPSPFPSLIRRPRRSPRTARLAEQLLRQSHFARRLRRHAALRRAAALWWWRHNKPPMTTMAARPGTIRPSAGRPHETGRRQAAALA
jgi:dissimilatory sulfite reductase (desulfoviridin) alpha/beta subunit